MQRVPAYFSEDQSTAILEAVRHCFDGLIMESEMLTKIKNVISADTYETTIGDGINDIGWQPKEQI